MASHQVLIAIYSQLQRYSVYLSTKSLHALLNACDKASDYSTALRIYETGMTPSQLDAIGLSVLIKCCDRLNLPHKAVLLLLQVYRMNHSKFESTNQSPQSEQSRKEESFLSSIRERVFAILVTNRAYILAVISFLYSFNYILLIVLACIQL